MAASLLKKVASFETSEQMYCFVLHNRKIYSTLDGRDYPRVETVTTRVKNVLQCLSTVMHLSKILATTNPRIQYLMEIITLEDHPGIPLLHEVGDFGNCLGEYPIFTFDAPKNCTAYWPMIDYSNWEIGFQSQTDIQRFHQEQQCNYPWETKLNKAVWRGSSTGGREIGETYPIQNLLTRLHYILICLMWFSSSFIKEQRKN